MPPQLLGCGRTDDLTNNLVRLVTVWLHVHYEKPYGIYLKITVPSSTQLGASAHLFDLQYT